MPKAEIFFTIQKLKLRMPSTSFDLFDLLKRLGSRDMQAYSRLPDDHKKAASPLVIMRWLSGTSDAAQVIRLNEAVNRYVFSLGAEKELLFKLLAAACTGSSPRTSWLKGPGAKSMKLATKAVAERYDLTVAEATQYLEVLDTDDILQCAEDAGWNKEDTKKLQTELGSSTNDGPRAAQKGRSGKKNLK